MLLLTYYAGNYTGIIGASLQLLQDAQIKGLQQKIMYSKAGSCKDTSNLTVVSRSSHASCLGTIIVCPLLSKITSCEGTLPMELSTLHCLKTHNLDL